MYATYFGLTDEPFAITPDPRYLFMSERHREALAHLFYGLGNRGGFVQLTGEIGAGKTTICRSLLATLPKNVDVALIMSPMLGVRELLLTICDELRIQQPAGNPSTKELVDRLNQHLLAANAKGRKTVLIIDEAQNLSAEVLEQIRLLTNLETERHKLLQIFLIGQPELREVLQQRGLRQLAQRVTARYHLGALTQTETLQYVRHRLSIAGCEQELFTLGALRKIFKISNGVPRTINILCDRALLGAYVTGQDLVDTRIVRNAAREVAGVPLGTDNFTFPVWARTAAVIVLSVTGTLTLANWWASYLPESMTTAHAVTAGAGIAPGVDPAPVPATVSSMSETRQVADVASSEDGVVEPEIGAMAAPAPVTLVADNASADRAAASLAALIGDQAPLRTDAELQLMRHWQLPDADAGPLDLCSHVVVYGLRCLFGVGRWSDLRRLDRPALLTLHTDADAPGGRY